MFAKKWIKLCCGLAQGLFACGLLHGAGAGQLADIPPHLSGVVNTAPMIMLNVPIDHRFFMGQYDQSLSSAEFHDGGWIYPGYFSSYRCYVYTAGVYPNRPFPSSGLFKPTSRADQKTFRCSGRGADEWSGNFLNWATMTRMDIVRKVLYGGARYVDNSKPDTVRVVTVLRRASLPNDSHSFAMFYNTSNPSVMRQYTPYSTNSLTFCNTTESNADAPSTTRGLNDRPNLVFSHTTTADPLLRVIQGTFRQWASNTFFQCGVDVAGRLDVYNQISDAGIKNLLSRYNRGDDYGSDQQSFPPSNKTQKFHVNVSVCQETPLMPDEARYCKSYRDENGAVYYKPTGILQNYADQAEFGLMTGSYDTPSSGGRLRKNLSSFDEVNANGTFKSTTESIHNTLDALRVYGWDYYRPTSESMYVSQGDAKFYNGLGCTDDPTLDPDSCASWGNPIGELYMESLRYLGGKDQPSGGTKTKDPQLKLYEATWSDPFKDDAKGTRTAKYGDLACRKINVINFSAGASSDDQDLGAFPRAPSGSFTLIGMTLKKFEDAISNLESKPPNRVYVPIPGYNTLTGLNSICAIRSGHANVNFSDITGMCPDEPSYNGSFGISGAALYAHTNRIRTTYTPNGKDPSTPSKSNQKAFKVNTYGVSMSYGHLKIESTISGKLVRITPIVYVQSTKSGSDGKPIYTQAVITGLYLDGSDTSTVREYRVNWGDSVHGGHFGSDGWGKLVVTKNAPVSPETIGTITITTRIGGNPSTQNRLFGYVLDGTTKDGIHFHSGTGGELIYKDPSQLTVSVVPDLSTGISSNLVAGSGTDLNTNLLYKIYADSEYGGGCNNCLSTDLPTSVTYPLMTSTDDKASFLNDPLWYAVKYGNFMNNSSTDHTPLYVFPTSKLEPNQWDLTKKNGQTNGGDGSPDGYFDGVYANTLTRALNDMLGQIWSLSDTAIAGTSSVLSSGNQIYTAKYSTVQKNGDLISKTVSVDSSTGAVTIADAATWQASVTSRNPNFSSRPVYVGRLDSNKGVVSFTTQELSDGAKTILQGEDTSVVISDYIDYLRGVKNTEKPTGTFRDRGESAIGMIFNSGPWYLGPPSARYRETDYGGGYTVYIYSATEKPRSSVFVGANDGMLHAFKGGDKGARLFSYIPSVMLPRLTFSSLEDGYTIQPYVDGSPFAGDWKGGTQWKTALVIPFGRGAQGVAVADLEGGTLPAKANSVAVWEFTKGNDEDMGYIVGVPQISVTSGKPRQLVALATQENPVGDSGNWFVALGNGYRSENSAQIPKSDGTVDTVAGGQGDAVLYLLPLAGPNGTVWNSGEYLKINTCAVYTTSKAGCGIDADGQVTPNGLGTPLPLDTNGDGFVDTIYAGDLKGNIWKFSHKDTSGKDKIMWGASNWETTLLFTAQDSGTTQPITGNLEALEHPLGGFVINFGTGKLLETGDTSAPKQSIYGIWDDQGVTDHESVSFPITRVHLQSQTASVVMYGGKNVVRLGVGLNGDGTPITDWTASDGKRGWVLDLPNANEQVVSGVAYTVPAVGLVVQSVIPKQSDVCDVSNTGYVYYLDPVQGTAPAKTFDLNNNSSIDSGDNIAMNVRAVGIEAVGSTGTGRTFRSKPGVSVVKVTGASQDIRLSTAAFKKGRIFWREVWKD